MIIVHNNNNSNTCTYCVSHAVWKLFHLQCHVDSFIVVRIPLLFISPVHSVSDVYSESVGDRAG